MLFLDGDYFDKRKEDILFLGISSLQYKILIFERFNIRQVVDCLPLANPNSDRLVNLPEFSRQATRSGNVRL